MSSSLAPTPTASEVPLYIPGLDGTFSGEFRSMTFEGARPISTQGAGDDAATVYEVMNKVHASTLGVDLKTTVTYTVTAASTSVGMGYVTGTRAGGQAITVSQSIGCAYPSVGPDSVATCVERDYISANGYATSVHTTFTEPAYARVTANPSGSENSAWKGATVAWMTTMGLAALAAVAQLA